MTDQTKLREAVARAIDPVALQEGSFAPFSCDGAREIADHILALPEIADALKREEALSKLSEILEAMPELNLSNFSYEEVRELNSGVIEAVLFLRATMSGGEKK